MALVAVIPFCDRFLQLEILSTQMKCKCRGSILHKLTSFFFTTFDKGYLAVVKIPWYVEHEDCFCSVVSCLLYILHVILQLHD